LERLRYRPVSNNNFEVNDMSEGEKKAGVSLTTGFTTTAEIRRQQDTHEGVYKNKKLLVPTLILIGSCILGFVLSLL
jgi:hypothetical protein